MPLAVQIMLTLNLWYSGLTHDTHMYHSNLHVWFYVEQDWEETIVTDTEECVIELALIIFLLNYFTLCKKNIQITEEVRMENKLITKDGFHLA